MQCTFEFRHESWLKDPVYALLEKHGVALCIAESEKLQVPEVITAGFVYWRLRMPEYSPRDVDTVSEKTQELTAAGKDVFVYFKHEENPQGAIWAEELLKRAGVTRITVPAPPSSPESA